MRTDTCLPLMILILAALSAPAAATVPNPATRTVGRDSQGHEWSVRIEELGPITLRSEEVVSTPNESKIQHYGYFTALDAKDRIWVVGPGGEGLRYHIESRKFDWFKIPGRGGIRGDLRIEDDVAWFRADEGVGTWQVGDRFVKWVYKSAYGLQPDAYLLTPDTLWVAATSNADPTGEVTTLVAAQERASGKTITAGRGRSPTGIVAWWPTALKPDRDGAVWVTRPTCGLVERLARDGQRRSWNLTPLAPDNLNLIDGGALLVARKAERTEAVPNSPEHDLKRTLEASVVYLELKGKEPQSVTLPNHLRESVLAKEADGDWHVGQLKVKFSDPDHRLELK